MIDSPASSHVPSSKVISPSGCCLFHNFHFSNICSLVATILYRICWFYLLDLIHIDVINCALCLFFQVLKAESQTSKAVNLWFIFTTTVEFISTRVRACVRACMWVCEGGVTWKGGGAIKWDGSDPAWLLLLKGWLFKPERGSALVWLWYIPIPYINFFFS